MERLADIVTDRRGAWCVVLLVLVVAAVSAVLAGQVEQRDDLLAFLPQDNEDIQHFREINQTFGGLDVAIVGIEVADAYAPDTLRRLQEATEALQALPNLEHVLSLANVDDFTPDPMGGIRTGKLVAALPTTAAESRALEGVVRAREHVHGTLVSTDGQALVVYAFATYGADTQVVAASVREAVSASFPEAALYWGGSPFVSTWIFEATQSDLARLTPWAVLAIVGLMLVAFRDLRGTLLGLVSTGIGIAVSQALMVACAVPLNVILGSMPIILFAVGSAYAIHILARYQAHRQDLGCEAALRKTLVHTGPTVLTAGLTTALGLLSFVVMDIKPMRIFGVFTAVGIVVTLLLSLTFVPAVIRLLALKPQAGSGPGPVARACMETTAALQRQRRPVAGMLAVLAVLGAIFASQVDNRVDQSTFYNPGSPPDLADGFLTERFGGATFAQVLVEGDLTDPHALREVRLLADRIAQLPNVHGVQHVGDVVATLNDAMESQSRIPDTRAKVEQLFGLLTGNPSVRQLVTDDRRQALLHIRLRDSDLDAVEAALVALERLAAEETQLSYRVAAREDAPEAVAARLQTLAEQRILAAAQGGETTVAPAALQQALRSLSPRADSSAVAQDLRTWLLSDENFVELTADEASAVASAVAGLPDGPSEDAVGEAARAALVATSLPEEEAVVRAEDLSWLLPVPLAERRSLRRAEAGARDVIAALQVEAKPAFVDKVAAALLDLDAPTAALPDDAGQQLSLVVNGMPVLHRGLSRSTVRNQLLSLCFALGLVAVVLAWRFRSVSSGLLATLPMGLALLVVYGGMGALGIHLDIGTSMLASIVIGAGVDYAVHLLSAWYATPDEPLDRAAGRAAARTGPAIWTNALMVAVGFFVLTLGDARPLRNVGGLTAAAMVTAALTTFLVLPALARRRQYSAAVAARDPADGVLRLPTPSDADPSLPLEASSSP